MREDLRICYKNHAIAIHFWQLDDIGGFFFSVTDEADGKKGAGYFPTFGWEEGTEIDEELKKLIKAYILFFKDEIIKDLVRMQKERGKNGYGYRFTIVPTNIYGEPVSSVKWLFTEDDYRNWNENEIREHIKEKVKVAGYTAFQIHTTLYIEDLLTTTKCMGYYNTKNDEMFIDGRIGEYFEFDDAWSGETPLTGLAKEIEKENKMDVYVDAIKKLDLEIAEILRTEVAPAYDLQFATFIRWLAASTLDTYIRKCRRGEALQLSGEILTETVEDIILFCGKNYYEDKGYRLSFDFEDGAVVIGMGDKKIFFCEK